MWCLGKVLYLYLDPDNLKTQENWFSIKTKAKTLIALPFAMRVGNHEIQIFPSDCQPVGSAGLLASSE
jgi:hypothetical protein